jgi:hypothetical protein
MTAVAKSADVTHLAFWRIASNLAAIKPAFKFRPRAAGRLNSDADMIWRLSEELTSASGLLAISWTHDPLCPSIMQTMMGSKDMLIPAVAIREEPVHAD